MAVQRNKYRQGRLTARPAGSKQEGQAKSGLVSLALNSKKEGLLYIPSGYTASQPASLALMLHGSGGTGTQGLSLLRPYADAYNLVLVAPASQAYTWDVIAADSFGADVILIDQTLETIFATLVIDPAHIAIGGFSDGASYALSLGLGNGDLFSHLIAFSPGFYYTPQLIGRPKVFMSHGVHDDVLPIGRCSRRIAPRLQNSGLAVHYNEFTGGHEVPHEQLMKAVQWFTGT